MLILICLFLSNNNKLRSWNDRIRLFISSIVLYYIQLVYDIRWNYFIYKNDATVFQITIPFTYAPTVKRHEFLQELLIVNLNLMYGKFSFNEKDNATVLSYRISGQTFEPKSLDLIIDALAYYSEMAYHVLKDEFGLKRIHAA